MRVLTALFLIFLTGCVSFPVADRNQNECVAAPGEILPLEARPSGDAVTKIVRFTDDGAFVRRCELTDLYYELQSPGPQIVVVYVHGWKHNGESTDSDLQKFNEQIAAIRAAEVRRTTPRRVVGVYVAWNGKRTGLPLVREFSFWGRKRAADRVSQSAAVTRLLGAIDSRRTQRNNPDDLVVAVGHSFGARILYNAVAQVLIHKTELAHPGKPGEYKRIEGIGDMVILLNPAFEASLFTTFNALHRQEYRFPRSQPPLLVSIASETDRATKLAFPLGQTLSFNGSPKRRTTLGNFRDYWTHTVDVRDAGPRDGDICSTEVCLRFTSRDEPDFVPYINAIADRTVMNGHNDVWNPKLVGFLARLIAGAGKAQPEIAQTAAR